MLSQTTIQLTAYSRGYHLITHEILTSLGTLPATGFVHIFIQHTSAAITINENADPSVRVDFENIFNGMFRIPRTLGSG